MRAIKILLAVVGVFAALVLIAVAVVAVTFDPNDYKGVATDTFRARTGRTLSIEQDLRLNYFPWLAVETGGVTVGSAQSFGGDTQLFLSATRVAARVKLVPLLSRRIEVGTVEIEGVTLNLARDAELRGNWQDLLDAMSSGADAAAPAEPSAAPAQTFAIEGVRIRDGSVYWRENTDELRYSATGLSLTTGGIGRGEPLAFETALQFNDELSAAAIALAASGVVTIAEDGSVTARDAKVAATLSAANGAPARAIEATAARIAFARATQTLAVEGLSTEMAGVSATWQLTGTELIDNPTVEGSVAVASAELARVFEQLQLSPPQGVDPGELGSLTGSAAFRFQAEPRVIDVTNVRAEALGIRLSGEGSLTGENELAGRIAIAEFTPNAAVQALLRAAVPPTVDVSALGSLALDTRFDTNLGTGRAALRDLTARVLGATINGNLEGIPGERGNVFRGSIATSRFPADAFAKTFASMLPPNLAASELGMIELSTTFTFDAGADTLTVAPLRAEIFGLRASGEVTGRDVTRAATWTGSAAVAEFSPQDLLRRFGLPPQQTSDPDAFTRATLSTRFTVTNTSADLRDIVLKLDDTTIVGTFALADFERPSYRFALDVDRVNADRYLPPKRRDAAAGEATAGDIELPQNNTMNLDGTMRVGSLELAGMQFQSVDGHIAIADGDMKLQNLHAQLYGGTFNGNFTVHAAGDRPGLALDGRAANLDLAPLITALTAEDANFSGTGNFDLNLAGSGRTVIANVETAAGDVSFSMTNGAIKGFNLGHALCRAYNFTQRAPAPPEQPAETPYIEIKGSAAVTGGTAQSNDLLARTSFMDISGRGSLQLVEQHLDYDLDATLTNAIAIPGCNTLDQFVGGSLPFEIEGTVTEPSITPDFSRLVRQQLQEEIEDRIRDRLRDLLR
ncbi:MAG TPA: AsmA family protein [Gammaproteobacteria bacterium]